MRKSRRSTAILVIAGVVMIAFAVTLRLVVTPTMTKLRGDTDSTAHLEGTATILSPQALQAGDMSHALLKDIPVTAARRVHVESAAGDTAIVHDDVTMVGPNHMHMADDHVYALDRTTLTEAPAPTSKQVENHHGLTISMPLHPSANSSMRYWDPATRTSPVLAYQGRGMAYGRSVYNYTARAAGPLEDTSTLAMLPKALPKSVLTQLLPLIGDDNTRNALLAALPASPDIIPVSYDTTDVVDVSADKDVGLPISARQQQTVTASIVSAGGRKITLMPVMAMDLTTTAASGDDTATTAGHVATLVQLLEVTVPLVLIVIGALSILVGVARRRVPPHR